MKKVELEEGNLRMEANNSSVQRISRVSSFYAHYTKRAIDIGIATVALLILIIPFIIVAIAIKLDSKGPVIFKQQRATKNQQSFDIYKFRSMSTEAPHNMATADLDATSYITRVGAFLRKTSIDELPQLINVLHGDMSIIVPRPVLTTETHLLELRHKFGCDYVLPGITGLAQISGRDEVDDLKKSQLDAQYADHLTLGMDAWIVVKSVAYVLGQKGIHEEKR